jgi:hypothetical protein
MAATARAERQRMGFVDGGDGVTDEELIFQQFMNDMSEDEDDNGGGAYFCGGSFLQYSHTTLANAHKGQALSGS